MQTTTLSDLMARRDEMVSDLALYGAARQGTAWYTDRVKALALVGEQIRALDVLDEEPMDDEDDALEAEDQADEVTDEQREDRYQGLITLAAEWELGDDQLAVEALAALVAEGKAGAALEALKAAGLI